MSNEYYLAGSTPAPNSPGASAVIRGQFTAIAAAFDKLPTMAGSADEFVLVNPTGTSLIASGFKFTDFATVTGVQTVTNKTLAWADNTFPGFGTGATKVAGTAADNVLLLAEADKLPALDGSLLTGIASAGLPVVPISKGGTGATTLGSAQTALGIDLKADADNAALTGVPTAPTALTGDNSTRIATTKFVTDTVTAIGATAPSNAAPLMNGSTTPGTNPLVSRDDHVHPVDTSRAPTSASTAGGTSFTPGGGIIATNVQAAILELDSEKAPASASTAAGTSFTPVGTIIATNVQTAIIELDTEKAPATASTATGTSFTAGGGIIATNVQAAILELDSEKAPVNSPSFGGTVSAPQNYNVTSGYGALQVGGVDKLRFGSDNSGQPFSFRNKIINGNFDVWQRGASFAAVSGQYTSDRWVVSHAATSLTTAYSQQTFGTAPTVVPGNPTYYFRNAVTANTGFTSQALHQRIENVTTFSGRTVTVSFYARSDANRILNISLDQFFGTGGSATLQTNFPSISITTVWQRFTRTITVPSVNGKTIGAGNFIGLSLRYPTTNQVTDIAQVQLEEGSIATPFEQRPHGLELSLCQRYYETVWFSHIGYGLAGANCGGIAGYKVSKRITPTVIQQTDAAMFGPVNCGTSSFYIQGGSVEAVTVYRAVVASGSCQFSETLIANAEL